MQPKDTVDKVYLMMYNLEYSLQERGILVSVHKRGKGLLIRFGRVSKSMIVTNSMPYDKVLAEINKILFELSDAKIGDKSTRGGTNRRGGTKGGTASNLSSKG